MGSTTHASYSELANALDAWAAYWGRNGAAQQQVSRSLLDAWGRLPEPTTAKRAAARVLEYHGGRVQCSRAAALLAVLDKIAK